MKCYKINVIPYRSMFQETDEGLKRFKPLRDTGEPNELPVDQFSGKRFFRNECGWPMNDIMAYEESQNDTVAAAVLRRVKVLPQDSGDHCETLQERFDTIVPSNWSSPSEFVGISKRLAKIQYEKMQQKVEAARLAQEASKRSGKVVKKDLIVEPKDQ